MKDVYLLRFPNGMFLRKITTTTYKLDDEAPTIYRSKGAANCAKNTFFDDIQWLNARGRDLIEYMPFELPNSKDSVEIIPCSVIPKI